MPVDERFFLSPNNCTVLTDISALHITDIVIFVLQTTKVMCGVAELFYCTCINYGAIAIIQQKNPLAHFEKIL